LPSTKWNPQSGTSSFQNTLAHNSKFRILLQSIITALVFLTGADCSVRDRRNRRNKAHVTIFKTVDVFEGKDISDFLFG
jgi:hypothetical protein